MRMMITLPYMMSSKPHQTKPPVLKSCQGVPAHPIMARRRKMNPTKDNKKKNKSKHIRARSRSERNRRESIMLGNF